MFFGYKTLILLSDSQVALSPCCPTQITFTKTILLPLKRFTSWSSVLTGQVSTVKLSLTSKSSTWITWDASYTYIRTWDTWNTSWRFDNDDGKMRCQLSTLQSTSNTGYSQKLMISNLKLNIFLPLIMITLMPTLRRSHLLLNHLNLLCSLLHNFRS